MVQEPRTPQAVHRLVNGRQTADPNKGCGRESGTPWNTVSDSHPRKQNSTTFEFFCFVLSLCIPTPHRVNFFFNVIKDVVKTLRLTNTF